MHKVKLVIAALIVLVSSSTAITTESSGIHRKIDSLLLKGDFKRAGEEADAAYEKNPNDPETICAKACVYRNMAHKNGIQVDRSRLGIKEFESGSAPLTPEVLKEAFKETSYYDRDIFSRAEALYYRIIELDASYRNAYFNLLNTYMEMEEYDNYFKVIDLFVKNQKSSKGCKEALFELAGRLFQRQSYAQAEKLYLTILRHFPEYAQARSDLGAVYASTGEIEKAGALFSEVYKRDPADLVNTENLIKTHITQEKFAEAYSVTLAVLKTEDCDLFHHFTAGQLAYMLGRDCAGHFNRYIELRKAANKGAIDDFFITVSKVYPELTAMPVNEKLSFLNQVLLQFFNNKFTYSSIITANTMLKYGKTPNPLIVLGATFDDRVYFPKSAIKYLNEIREYAKTDPRIMEPYDLNYNFARNYINLRQYDKALEHLKKNYETKKDDARVLHAMGKAHQEKGDPEGACRYYTECGRLEDKENMYSINASIRAAVYLGCYGDNR